MPEWDFYNYLDEGRFFTENVISDFELSKKEIEFLEKEKTTFLRNKDFGYNEVFYSTKEEIKNSHRAWERKETLENRETEEKSEIEENIKKLLGKKGSITLNGIKRSRSGFFEYQNNKIGYKGYNVLQIENEEKDFNEIFNKIVWNYLNSSEILEPLECGNFKINIKMKQSKNNYGSMYYVEGIRINKDEREDVIKRAICYQNKKDFKEFLKEVSKCSINIHNVLATGLTFSIKEDIFTNIPLVRENNHHFIVYEKSKYRISNINTLINLQSVRVSNYSYYNNKKFNVNLLAEYLEKNSELNYDKAIEVIKEGLKGYKQALRKAKQLLKETIAQLQIKELEVENENFTGKENIAIEVQDGTLTLKFNKHKLFSSLKERKVIIGYLNKKLEEQLEKHLSSVEEKERQLENDC